MEMKNSTFHEDLSNVSEMPSLWKNITGSDTSISSVEKSFNPAEIKKIVDSLVMTRFGSFYRKRFRKTYTRSKYFSTNSEQSSDMSIGTENISNLISGRSSDVILSFAYLTPLSYISDYYTIINPDVSESVSNTTNQTLEDEVLQLKISILQQTKHQIIKAISYHERYKRSAMYKARLEAEKLLLVTDVSLLRPEDMQCDKSLQSWCSGTLEISRINIFPTINYHGDHHFMCLITSATSIYATEISKIKSNGVIHFSNSFTLPSLKPNFKLMVKIYCLTSEEFKKPSKCMTICGSHEEDIYTRGSLFSLWEKFDIKRHHLSQSGILRVPLRSGIFMASISSRPEINLSLTTCLDVGSNFLGYPLWNRQWCVVAGTELKFYNYPPDLLTSTPIKIIDLLQLSEMKILPREECARKHTLSLKMNSGDCLLMSWESTYEFQCWVSTLRLIITEVHLWKGKKL